MNKRAWQEWAAVGFVSAVPFLFYARAAVGAGMFYFGDIARFYYPTRVLYADALRAGRLPLWQPEILLGFPLLAEMQTGALYPLHLLLYRFLPLDWALNYDILLHLAWLAAGMYVLARAHGISIVGAMLAALALTLGGFGTARITHPNVLNVASWLPWLLWLYGQGRAAATPIQAWHKYWPLLALAVAMQWLAGHPQFALINLLMVGGYAIAHPSSQARRLEAVLGATVAILLGTLLAAAQLLPTYELAQQSTRAGGVDENFFTQFSYHPFYLALLVAPFLRGNPYPNVSVEVIAYLGILPLWFAIMALLLHRKRATFFWGLVALGALTLALGGYIPFYGLLRYLPLFNLFRVPARFLFPFALALAMLAGIGFDALQQRTIVSRTKRGVLAASFGFLPVALALLVLANVAGVEVWLDAWRFLPILFVGLGLWLILRVRQISRALFALVALTVTLFDLIAFAAVYAQTYNAIAPRAQVFPRPRVLDVLNLDPGARVLTSEWILPWVSVMNESLYPNLNAAHGVQAAHGYTPLAPRRTMEFLANLSPAMVNLLGVRYYLIPQMLPVDPQTEAANVRNPLMADPIAAPLEFTPVEANVIEIESWLAQSVHLPTGAVVAQVILETEAGRRFTLPLRAGMDTAEWAYERSDVLRMVKHARPEIASSFPARSAFPIETHVGHTYRARLKFSDLPVPIARVWIEPKFDPGLIHVQRLMLWNSDTRIDLGPLVHKGNYALVYRSEDVAVYENREAAPRAFLTHSVYRADDATALERLRAADFGGEIFIADGPELPGDTGQGLFERATIIVSEPERVVVEVKADFDAYLVLTDAWDPGWMALVDGTPVPVERADVILRAVRVSAGTHRVEFLYHPRSVYMGLILSGIGAALLGILLASAWLWRVTRRKA